MWNWLVENRTWVFSGIGVSVMALLVALVRRSKAGINQRQRGGDHSVNVQSAGSIELDRHDTKRDK